MARAASSRPVAETVRDGDQVKSLEAVRDVLARMLDEATPRDCAPIAARLSQVLERLAALSKPEGVSKRDELAKRRASRRAISSSASGS